MRLEGRAVVVTGASRGLGRRMALDFASAGASVSLAARDRAALEQLASQIGQQGGKALVVQTDVTKEADCERLMAATVEAFGRLDVLINNAGIAGPTAAVEEISVADWDRTIAVDLNGMFYCTRRAVPLLKAAGGGSIVNLSSVAGRLGFRLRTPYSAAKWAVVGFTKSLAIELGPSNIRVNAIQPGIVEGERIDRVIAAKAAALGITEDAFEQELLSSVSLRRMVTAQDIANMALFLATPAGAGISGQALSVCGNVETLR